MERIALIADVHGNMPALDVVLADIRGRGIKKIFCLGDLVNTLKRRLPEGHHGIAL